MENLLLCIKWILYASRPLRPEELYFAILSGGDPTSLTAWDPEDVTRDDIDRFLLSSSKGLAELTKSKSQTVQFIHESVRDFLLKDKGLSLLQADISGSSIGPVQDFLKQCCQHYIISVATNCPDLDKEGHIPETAKQFPFLDYSIHHVFRHAELAASHSMP